MMTQHLNSPLLKKKLTQPPSPGDDLCGVSLSPRFHSNLITIWNRDGSNQKSIASILKCILDTLPEKMKPKESAYYYKKHSEHADYKEVMEKARATAVPPVSENSD